MAVELDVGHPVLLPPGSGEVVGDSADRRLEILADGDELHATWSRFGPHRDGASPHVHRNHSDLFYVLAGELTVLVGPEHVESVLPAGTLVLAPPLVVHGFRNASDATRGSMVFKLSDPDAHARALALDGAHLFDPSGKNQPFKEWVVVPAAHEAEWDSFAQHALRPAG